MQNQHPQVRRETFIALRARREAYHVASDMLYEQPIDVRTVACQGCGGWIEVRGSTVTDPLTCPVCKARTPLPPYLRARYLPRTTVLPSESLDCTSSAEEWDDFAPIDVPSWEVPRWLIWFSVILVTLLLGVVAGLLNR